METSDKPKNKGGRPKGSMSKIAAEARLRAQETGLLPHEILLSMARGDPQREYVRDADGEITERWVNVDIEQRRAAATNAAPYFAPKISTVEVIHGVPDHELDNIIAQLAAEAGIDLGADGEEQADEDSPSVSPRSRRVINPD